MSNKKNKRKIDEIEMKSAKDLSTPGKVDLKHRFIELRSKGFSIRNIAKKLKLSPQTISNWQVELEEEIASLKAIELEALYDEYYLLKNHRIKLIGSHIKNIQNELKKRNLSDLSTDKLFDLLLKYLDTANKEYSETKFLSDEDLRKMSDENSTKMDSSNVCTELVSALQKYRKGLISDAQVRQEIHILQTILKADEQEEIHKKLEILENLLAGRK